jgi:hypothetical protein
VLGTIAARINSGRKSRINHFSRQVLNSKWLEPGEFSFNYASQRPLVTLFVWDGHQAVNTASNEYLLRPMNVLILQLDGKVPNIALMRVAAHHRALGNHITFRWGARPRRELWDRPDLVYASAIFEKTRRAVEVLKCEFPQAIVGGTGVDVALKLEDVGITTLEQDYSIYPDWRQSIGFSQRGCRLRCGFCVVPTKEGNIRPEKTISEIWRGNPWPRELILLDNDFFGQPGWQSKIQEIIDGKFKVSFNQGINARFLTDESAAAIASVDYRSDDMRVKRIYTAWDSKKDQHRLFCGLQKLVDHGVNRDHIMVYMLIGYLPGESESDWLHRQSALRAFGARPYPMPFTRTPATVGFQRWCIGAYDKRIRWSEWKGNNYRPEGLSLKMPDPTERSDTLDFALDAAPL